MKKVSGFLVMLLICFYSYPQSVGIGTKLPGSNAILDITSSNKGLLIPRLTTAQRTTLGNTATDGLTVYDSTTKSYWYYNSTLAGWANMLSTSNSPWVVDGVNVYNSNTGNVGIGTNLPAQKLQVVGSASISNDILVNGIGYFGTNSYSAAQLSENSLNFFESGSSGSGDKIVFDWRYNNIKAGIGYKTNPAVYGSDMYFHLWSAQDNFIFGRDDPFYGNGSSFVEWMRLKNNGYLGIGTAAPDSKLHVLGDVHFDGKLKIVDGTQAADRVLTTDDAGLASWKALPGNGPNPWFTNGNNIYENYQYVGIHNSFPGFPLNFETATGDKISLYGVSGAHYGLGVQSALLQIHTDGAGSDIGFGYGTSANFNERGRIVNQGEYGMKITGRLQLLTGTNSAGLWLTNTANNSNVSFIGLASDNQVGFYGPGGAGWGFTMNTVTANIGIGLNGADPARPLSFPAALGEKILLYPGANGEVGIGVYGNELRLHADNPGAKVSFGTQDNNGVFTEVGKFEKNGEYALSVFGSIWANGTTYASDSRFKKNVTDLEAPLNKVLQLHGVNYEMNSEAFPGRNFDTAQQVGLIAQEVEKIVPEVVSTGPDGYKAIDYAKLVPLLIESIKTQQQQITGQQKEIDALKELYRKPR